MKKILLSFEFDGKTVSQTAVVTDDLTELIADHPDNQASELHNGIAEELCVWNLHFDTPDGYELVFDFYCPVDEDGYEHPTLDPVDVLIWKDNKPIGDKTIPFTVEVL